METEPGHDPAVWAEMGELGWLGVAIPEAFGGSGLGLVISKRLVEGHKPAPGDRFSAKKVSIEHRTHERGGYREPDPQMPKPETRCGIQFFAGSQLGVAFKRSAPCHFRARHIQGRSAD
jgi:hypothetical protein